jgi:hypothetical protein
MDSNKQREATPHSETRCAGDKKRNTRMCILTERVNVLMMKMRSTIIIITTTTFIRRRRRRRRRRKSPVLKPVFCSNGQ